MVELDGQVDTGRQWIFGLVFIFTLGIIAMILIPVVDSFVRPALIQASTLQGAELDLYITQTGRVLFALKSTPFILMFVVFVFLILSVIRRERNQFVV